MTVFLICMLPVSAFFGFMMCAICVAAADADRRYDQCFDEWQREQKEGDA